MTCSTGEMRLIRRWKLYSQQVTMEQTFCWPATSPSNQIMESLARNSSRRGATRPPAPARHHCWANPPVSQAVAFQPPLLPHSAHCRSSPTTLPDKNGELRQLTARRWMLRSEEHTSEL